MMMMMTGLILLPRGPFQPIRAWLRAWRCHIATFFLCGPPFSILQKRFVF